jgi:hypothetical protein
MGFQIRHGFPSMSSPRQSSLAVNHSGLPFVDESANTRGLLMRTLSLINTLFIAGVLMASGLAHTAPDASRCYSIQDADRRHVCLAQTRGESSRCYSVRNEDQRHGCLAVTRQERSRCYSIREGDARAMCLAVVSR